MRLKRHKCTSRRHRNHHIIKPCAGTQQRHTSHATDVHEGYQKTGARGEVCFPREVPPEQRGVRPAHERELHALAGKDRLQKTTCKQTKREQLVDALPSIARADCVLKKLKQRAAIKQRHMSFNATVLRRRSWRCGCCCSWSRERADEREMKESQRDRRAPTPTKL